MTYIEKMFPDELLNAKTDKYAFMGQYARDLTKDELLIAFKYAIDSLNNATESHAKEIQILLQ